MTNDKMPTLRVPAAFKDRLKRAARRQNLSVAEYVKQTLETHMERDVPVQVPATKEEQEVLNRCLRGLPLGAGPLTNEEIDEAVYGQHCVRERGDNEHPTEAERAVLERFIGGIRHGGLTRNIDESLYGKV